jgi:hypothetical protein
VLLLIKERGFKKYLALLRREVLKVPLLIKERDLGRGQLLC